MLAKGLIVVGVACLLVAPAQAQLGCEGQAASVYFEPGGAIFNPQSKEIIDRLTKQAKACGVSRVVAEAPTELRAKAISQAFESHGVKVILGNIPRAGQAGSPLESIRERSAVVRVDASNGQIG